MRPRVLLPKGGKVKMPSVLTESPRQVQPKKVDDFMDRVVDIKDMSGKVIFTGTPRQWQPWAQQQEIERRLAVGLPARPKEPVPRSRSRR